VCSCLEAALTEKRAVPTARAAIHRASARSNLTFIIVEPRNRSRFAVLDSSEDCLQMNAVLGRVASRPIAQKDRCAESVLQRSRSSAWIPQSILAALLRWDDGGRDLPVSPATEFTLISRPLKSASQRAARTITSTKDLGVCLQFDSAIDSW
jgi:hypothetical protein